MYGLYLERRGTQVYLLRPASFLSPPPPKTMVVGHVTFGPVQFATRRQAQTNNRVPGPSSLPVNQNRTLPASLPSFKACTFPPCMRFKPCLLIFACSLQDPAARCACRCAYRYPTQRHLIFFSRCFFSYCFLSFVLFSSPSSSAMADEYKSRSTHPVACIAYPGHLVVSLLFSHAV